MRTTIRLDDSLFAEVKAEAARTGRTMTEVIEDALRSRADGSHGGAVKQPAAAQDGHNPDGARPPRGCVHVPPQGFLTAREREVLELAAQGCTARDISSALYVSVKDIEYHAANLLGKLLARNRTEAVAKAFVIGVLTLEWPPRARRELSETGIQRSIYLMTTSSRRFSA